MGLETDITDIQSLNQNWPPVSDPRAQGADHIRNIKKAIQLTFPNLKQCLLNDAQFTALGALIGDGSGTFTINGKLTVSDTLMVPTVTDWTTQQAVGAKDAEGRYLKPVDADGRYLKPGDADRRYAKLSGASFYGDIYTSTSVYAGYGSGFGGATSEGGLRWSNGGVGFGNPVNNAGKPLFAGFWTVSDIIGNPGHDNSGVNLRGWDYQGNLYNWFFAWNGNITTPKGLVAFQSDVDTALTKKLSLSGGAVSRLQVTGNFWALGNSLSVYNGAANALCNTYVDNSGAATWDLNGGTPGAPTGNKSWLRLYADGTLRTGKDAVAFQSQLPFTDQNLRVQVFDAITSDGTFVRLPQAFKTLVGVTAQQHSSGNEGIRPIRIETNVFRGDGFNVSIWSEDGNIQYTFVAYGYF